MTSPPFPDLARRVVDRLVERALDGEFLPGVSWVIDTHSLEGDSVVRFFVDGDLDAVVASMDPAPPVPPDMLLRVRGEVRLELHQETVSALRRAYGVEPEAAPADDSLTAGYREGLVLTRRTVDELEGRAAALAQRTVTDLAADIAAAGHDPAEAAAVSAIFEHQTAALRARMDARRARLDALDAALAAGAGADVFERILGEEYAISSEAQADVAAFEDVVRRALREAASRFG